MIADSRYFLKFKNALLECSYIEVAERQVCGHLNLTVALSPCWRWPWPGWGRWSSWWGPIAARGCWWRWCGRTWGTRWGSRRSLFSPAERGRTITIVITKNRKWMIRTSKTSKASGSGNLGEFRRRSHFLNLFRLLPECRGSDGDAILKRAGGILMYPPQEGQWVRGRRSTVATIPNFTLIDRRLSMKNTAL